MMTRHFENRSDSLKPFAKLYLSNSRTEGVFGDGKFRLLKHIKEGGTLTSAAMAMGISYRKAWGELKRAEESLGNALVLKSRGGSERGATKLTAFGERMVNAWSDFRSELDATMKQAYRDHLSDVLK